MSVTTATATDAPVRTFSRAKTRGLAVAGAGVAALAGWELELESVEQAATGVLIATYRVVR